MERVAFLIEDTGEHLGCLLNPETVVMSRTAGVEPRRSAGGKLTGTGLADDPLLFTGGGHTELRLDLLFDVDLAPASLRVQDVRQMTRPIWALAENSAEVERQRRPPSVRFVWGRAWNVPGIVTARLALGNRLSTSERLDSWIVSAWAYTLLGQLDAAEQSAATAVAGLNASPALAPADRLRTRFRMTARGRVRRARLGGCGVHPTPAVVAAEHHGTTGRTSTVLVQCSYGLAALGSTTSSTPVASASGSSLTFFNGVKDAL